MIANRLILIHLDPFRSQSSSKLGSLTPNQLVLSVEDFSYSIQWPDTDEVFIFDAQVHHTRTKSLLTDSVLVTFYYDNR